MRAASAGKHAASSPAMTAKSGPRAVEPLAHLLAGLEERHRFLLDRDMRPGARIAPRAGRAMLHREGPEAAQLDPVAARHGGDDLAQYRVDDVLDVALIEMRILRGDALHQLGLDHCGDRLMKPTILVAGRRLPKRQQTVKIDALLHRAPRLEALRQRAEARGIE